MHTLVWMPSGETSLMKRISNFGMLDGAVIKITEVIKVIVDLLTWAFSKQMWLKRFKTSCVLKKHEASKQYPLSFRTSLFIWGIRKLETRSHITYLFHAKSFKIVLKALKKFSHNMSLDLSSIYLITSPEGLSLWFST